jgi:hypothetical protein
MHAEFFGEMAIFGREWLTLRKNSGASKKKPSLHCYRTGTSRRPPEHAIRLPVTLHRWLRDPDFDAAYREARRQAYGQSIARLQQGSAAAATTLLKVMLDAAAPYSTRVRAADSVLNHAAKAIEIEDIEARVAALEQAANGNPRR